MFQKNAVVGTKIVNGAILIGRRELILAMRNQIMIQMIAWMTYMRSVDYLDQKRKSCKMS